MPHLKALTSVRALAALYVALYHMVQPFTRWGPLTVFMSAGYTAVGFFFMLSGFILTYTNGLEYAAGRADTRRFWVARFARVYPIYLVVLLWSGYIGRAAFHQHIHTLAFVADLLMVQSWSIRMVSFFNVAAWSLSVEAFFYLVFPFAVLRLRPRSLSTGLMMFGGCYAGKPGDRGRWPAGRVRRRRGPIRTGFPVATTWCLRCAVTRCCTCRNFFAASRLGGFTCRRRSASVSRGLPSGAALRHSPRSFSFHGIFRSLMLHNGLLLPLFGLLILGLSQRNLVSRVLSVAPMLLLGEASYSFYLVHFNFKEMSYHDWGWPTTVAYLVSAPGDPGAGLYRAAPVHRASPRAGWFWNGGLPAEHEQMSPLEVVDFP